MGRSKVWAFTVPGFVQEWNRHRRMSESKAEADKRLSEMGEAMEKQGIVSMPAYDENALDEIERFLIRNKVPQTEWFMDKDADVFYFRERAPGAGRTKR
jgi:hypothetical protein